MRKNKSEKLEVEKSPRRTRRFLTKSVKFTVWSALAGLTGFAIARFITRDSV